MAQQVSQASSDNGLLVPMVEAVERECGAGPGQALADSGFFSQENVEEPARRNIDAYVSDSHLGRELNWGVGVRGHTAARHRAHRTADRPVRLEMRAARREMISRVARVRN